MTQTFQDYVTNQFLFAPIDRPQAYRLITTEQFILRDSVLNGLSEDHKNALAMIQAIKQQFVENGIFF